MNYETKKSVMKSLKLFQTIIFLSEFLTFMYLIIFRPIEDLCKKLNIALPDYYLLLTSIATLISTVYFVFFILYLNKKIKQTKEEFYSKTKLFKTFSVISLILSTGVGIMLMFISFTKDDTNPKKIIARYKTKQSKPTVILTKETKKQIRALKYQKRHGIISKENYQKQYNQLIKQKRQLD